jgi:hypothetical protein
MGIIEITRTRISIIEIMEIDKEGIWNVYVAKKKDIRIMIIYYGSNIYNMRIRILSPRLGSMLLLWSSVYSLY